MKTRQIFLLTMCAVVFSVNSHAQFWKKMIDKAEDKIEREAERRAERRVNKKIDKVFDKTEEKIDEVGNGNNSSSEDKTGDGGNSDMEGMMGDILSANKDVKTESSYTFQVTATMLVTNYSTNETREITIKQSYGKKAIMSELQEPKSLIINDFDNEAAIMIDPEAKTAQILSMAWMKKMMGQGTATDESESDTAKVEKTGNTKTILGYTCYQYIITDKDVKIDAWFAPDVNFDYQDYLSGMNKMLGNKKTNTASLLNQGQGYVMEMIIFEKEKRTSEMFIRDISEKPITINLSDYTIQKMF